MKIIKLEPKKFSDKILSMKGISKKTVEEHLKLYTGYVNKYNEIQEKLTALSQEDYAKANQVFSTIRELKVELSFAWGGVVNHEIYFLVENPRQKITMLPRFLSHIYSSMKKIALL